MKTLTRAAQEQITAQQAIRLLEEGNIRFISNLKFNRNFLQQVNETRDGQHPFAVIISCMDSRTSAELIFDQGLGDVFSIRIAGNVINDEILGSAEFGCQVVGAKVVVVLGHSACGAIKGAIDNVELGNLGAVLRRIQQSMPLGDAQFTLLSPAEKMSVVTRQNVSHGIAEIRSRSKILADLEKQGKVAIVGGIYDISTGRVDFFK